MKEQHIRKIVREELLREEYELPDDRPADPKKEIIRSVGDLNRVETSTSRGEIVFTIKNRWYMKVKRIKNMGGEEYRVDVEITDFKTRGSRPSEYNFTATSFPNLKRQLIDLAREYGGRQKEF